MPRPVVKPPDEIGPISFKYPLTPGICANIVQELIKHILFMKQQIPLMFNECVDAVFQEEEKKMEAAAVGRMRRTPMDVKRASRSVEQLMFLFEDIEAAFMDRKIESALLILGSTPINPKLVFALKFNYDHTVMAEGFDEEKAAAECSRKILRTFIQSTSDIFEKNLLRGEPLENYTPKLAYNLKPRRTTGVMVVHIGEPIVTSDSDTDEQSPDPAAVSPTKADKGAMFSFLKPAYDCAWYLNRNTPKGFRMRDRTAVPWDRTSM